MLSTVFNIAGIVAIIGGASYLVYQYYPYFVEYYNQFSELAQYYADLLPDWLNWALPVTLTLVCFGLIVKLL